MIGCKLLANPKSGSRVCGTLDTVGTWAALCSSRRAAPCTANSIALTLRRRKDTRAQDPALQVRARREERVRLVTMPAEKE